MSSPSASTKPHGRSPRSPAGQLCVGGDTTIHICLQIDGSRGRSSTSQLRGCGFTELWKTSASLPFQQLHCSSKGIFFYHQGLVRQVVKTISWMENYGLTFKYNTHLSDAGSVPNITLVTSSGAGTDVICIKLLYSSLRNGASGGWKSVPWVPQLENATGGRWWALLSSPLLPMTLPSSQPTGQKMSLQNLALLSEGRAQL